MTNNTLFQIRVTGILIEDSKILLVKQRVTETRIWSLPGGRLEHGETIEFAVIREMKEETGINIKIIKLLYVCEKTDDLQQLIHITFLVEKTGGRLALPTNECDENLITDVKMIPIDDLCNFEFSKKFKYLVQTGFKEAGSYQGLKKNIGL